jgi:aerobic-type carbon monoxide dehydrogenase small subunit (CoxS/CutS family)
VEGHAVEGKLSPVQQAFVDHFAFQCGYCTSGFINETTRFIEELARNPVSNDQVDKSIADALGEHVCRCTGYVRYYEAVRALVLSDPDLTKEG